MQRLITKSAFALYSVTVDLMLWHVQQGVSSPGVFCRVEKIGGITFLRGTTEDKQGRFSVRKGTFASLPKTAPGVLSGFNWKISWWLMRHNWLCIQDNHCLVSDNYVTLNTELIKSKKITRVLRLSCLNDMHTCQMGDTSQSGDMYWSHNSP